MHTCHCSCIPVHTAVDCIPERYRQTKIQPHSAQLFVVLSTQQLFIASTNPEAQLSMFFDGLVSCPAGARLTARNGLVNEVEFLGLSGKDK